MSESKCSWRGLSQTQIAYKSSFQCGPNVPFCPCLVELGGEGGGWGDGITMSKASTEIKREIVLTVNHQPYRGLSSPH